MNQLTDRFKANKKERLKAGKDVPDGLVRAVSSAATVMTERNELLHSLWPGEENGWRNRPTGSVPTKYVGLAALNDVIARLVESVDGFGQYLSSPIDWRDPSAAASTRTLLPTTVTTSRSRSPRPGVWC